MKYAIAFVLIAFMLSCSTVNTAFDYDRQADFSKYKTYGLNPNRLSESVGQLNADRIMKAVEDELAKKGFSKSGSPDAIVDVHMKSEQKQEATATTTGMGMGPWGAYRFGGGFATTSINYDDYTEGTLFITLIDASSKKIIWQGTATKTLNENASTEKREANIKTAVEQIMANYPPRK